MLRIVESNARTTIAANKPQMQPPTRSPLLARMATFLPALRAANADLQHAAPSSDAFALEEQKDCSEHNSSLIRTQGSSDDDSHDENSRGDVLNDVSLGDGGPRIEMNLTCGLLDLQNGAACSAAEATMQDGCSIEAALGNSVKAALEQSPELLVDGAPASFPRSASDVHLAGEIGPAEANSCAAVDDMRSCEQQQASGSAACCVDTACCGDSVQAPGKPSAGDCDNPGDRIGAQQLDGCGIGTTTGTSRCNESRSVNAGKRAKIEVLSTCDR